MLRTHSAESVLKAQRTPEGMRFERWIGDLRARHASDRDFRNKVNAQVRSMMERAALTPGSVHVNKLLTNLSVGYRNDEYIGLRILPIIPVGLRSDSFVKWDKRNLLNAPSDLLSERANANEITVGASTGNYSLKDYGLKRHVDNETLKNSDDPFKDFLDNVETINEMISLKREIRIAAIVTATANYSGNTSSLAGSEWNATSSAGIYTGGAPVNNIRTAWASTWSGYGRTKKVMASDLETFNVLSNHAQIRGLFGLNDSGLATQQQIARYFGADEYLVTEARYDSANIGQTASYSRIWGKFFWMGRVAASPSRQIAAFGTTFQDKADPFTSQWFSPDEGKSGGHYNKVAVSEDYVVLAPDSAYLYTNPIT